MEYNYFVNTIDKFRSENTLNFIHNLGLHRIIDFGEGDSLAYGRKKALYLCGNFLVSIFLGNLSSLYEFGLGIGEILVVIEFLADGKDN